MHFFFIAIATLKNINKIYFFALIYNILGIPLAAFGFLSPILAGAAMALSSISVLMNALRLKKSAVPFHFIFIRNRCRHPHRFFVAENYRTFYKKILTDHNFRIFF